MKIVSVASEMTPFAKTGGLADVAGTLTKELHALGHDVLAFLPYYRDIDLQAGGFELVVERIDVPLGNDKETARIYHAIHDGVQVYLVDHPGFFHRDHLYGTATDDYPDNDRRFSFFQRAVLEALKAIRFAPDIIHCHDWQCGLVPVYLKTLYKKDAFFKKTRSVFTIHNLAYQGNFPPDSLPMMGIGWEEFKLEKLEFYGKVSLMKGGIVYSDAVTTVSERYTREIQTKEFGCGLENVFATRTDHLYGIINGIDYKEWNPETDKDIAARFSAASIEKKAASKQLLQRDNGFEENPKIPLIGITSRLVDQKGFDILIPAIEDIIKLGFQIVLLGTGEEKYHKILRGLAKTNKSRLGIHIIFDAKMAKEIYAGSDFFLMPSYYEPCGLGQMIALRYGTVPLVRETGGLADTIDAFDKASGKGNGFVFKEYKTEALLECLRGALEIYKSPGDWSVLVQNAMKSDFSWKASAKRYIEVFEETLKQNIKNSKS